MTDAQLRALIAATERGLGEDLTAAWAAYRELVLGGMAPRDAVRQTLDGFVGEFRSLLQEAFTAVMASAVGTAAATEMTIDVVSLSQTLYRNAEQVGANVQGIANAHARGFNDARKLALDLFEGYGFREEETLVLAPGNRALPQYLREAVLPDQKTATELSRVFARIKADNLRTPALRAAYLEAIDAVERGVGQEALDKKLRAAYYEKMRYYAERIARTELARAYTTRQSAELMDDTDVAYVRIKLSSRHPAMDICDTFANVDRYGLGRGVYPKALAPRPPFHPHCLCVVAPALDISRRAQPRENGDAERAYLNSLSPSEAARVSGSREKLAQALEGTPVVDLWNRGTDPAHRITTVGATAARLRGV